MPYRRKFALILWPLSLVYRFIVTLRNMLFDVDILKSEKFNMPVISVGNITVGGTGKTPHIEYLTHLLGKRYKLAVLSRGYKRKSKGFVLANENSTVNDIGDEPLQIKRKFPKITVAVDAKRKNGIEQLILEGAKSEKQFETILLDDAYQHRYVQPGLSILLIDYNNPIDEDYMLPLGNLREPEISKHRANFIIISKCPDTLKPIDCRIMSKRFKTFPHQKLFFTTLRYSEPQAVFYNEKLFENINQSTFALMVTGIAQPYLFQKHINSIVSDSEIMQFPDHHAFTQKDFDKIVQRFNAIANPDKVIVTTEKDAIRLREIASIIPDALKPILYFIPVKVDFLYDGKEQFDKKVIDYVNQNKRNR